jgi:hypothetical protein
VKKQLDYFQEKYIVRLDKLCLSLLIIGVSFIYVTENAIYNSTY